MKKKYAFMLMGDHYNPKEHKATFETENQISYLITVKNIEEAFAKLPWLIEEGIGAIELCGAFGEENTQKMIDMTDNKIAIGYVTNKPEQDDLFDKFFSSFG